MKATIRQGFSITELVVMLAVVTVVFLLLLPALAQVRDPAMQAQCRENLRKMHQGALAYQADYRSIPGSRYGWTSNISFSKGTVKMTLTGMLVPRYVTDFNSAWCPAESKTLPKGGPHWFWKWDGAEGRSMQVTKKHPAQFYTVGSDAWARNQKNQRFAWSTFGSVYSIPASVVEATTLDESRENNWICRKLTPAQGKYTDHGNLWGQDVEANPRAMYLAEGNWLNPAKEYGNPKPWGSGVHLYSAQENLTDRHGDTVNWLAIDGTVSATKKIDLVDKAKKGESPWVWKYTKVKNRPAELDALDQEIEPPDFH